MGAVVHDLEADARPAWRAHGHQGRHFFAHRVIRLAKGGVDGLKLARRMCGDGVAPGQLRQILVHALPPATDDLPEEVFFDDDLIWHQQHLGLAGHVATASLVLSGPDVYVPTLVSDLVQRIGRRQDVKSRVNNRFKGWPQILVHAALGAARDLGARRVLVPGADLARTHTDAARDVQRALFDRVYDNSVGPPFRAVRERAWWVLDVADNAHLLVDPVVGDQPLPAGPAVCLHHDIERGWGHLDADPTLAARADRDSPAHLAHMLRVEADARVAATYSIVGILMEEIAPPVRAGGHAVAFHSYDHADPDEPGADDQLRRCRHVDYRIKGYRPARSRLGAELTAEQLAFHNFEWLASSRYSLETNEAVLDEGIVRIPIITDDFALYRGTAYDHWEAALLDEVTAVLAAGSPAVFSLHDCYGDLWLDRYPALIDRVGELGRFATLDEVAADVLLAQAW